MPICTISLRFFSPPEKPTLTGRLSISASMLELAASARASFRNSAPDSGFSSRLRALGVERLAQELDVGDAGDLDRILEAEEQPGGGALVRVEGEEVDPAVASCHIPRSC